MLALFCAGALSVWSATILGTGTLAFRSLRESEFGRGTVRAMAEVFAENAAYAFVETDDAAAVIASRATSASREISRQIRRRFRERFAHVSSDLTFKPWVAAMLSAPAVNLRPAPGPNRFRTVNGPSSWVRAVEENRTLVQDEVKSRE